MKTYPLIISEWFPQSHPRAGEPTRFFLAVHSGKKKHTIRNNPEWWQPRIEKVAAGEALLSLRQWSGIPYRSKQRKVWNVAKYHCPGIEYIKRSHTIGEFIISDGTGFSAFPAREIAKNDGLEVEDFLDWFQDWPVGEWKVIIHFSIFRYLPRIVKL